MKKIIFGALFVLMILPAMPGGISAQGETLSLERTRELALLNSRSLARYNMAIQSSQLAEKTRKHRYLPSLSLSGSAASEFLSKDGFSQDLTKDFTADAGISLSYNLPIWEGGKNSILGAINSINTEISRQDALAEYYRVLDSADTSYYSVLEAAAALEAAEGSLETAVLSLSMAEIRRESGMISEADYLQALSEKAGKETSRNQSRRNLAVANLGFKELTGLAEIPPLEPVDFASAEELIQLLSEIDDSKIEPLYASLWKQVQSRNPAMVKAALNSERSEKEVSRAARDYSPTLNADLATGLRYSLNSGFEPTGRLSLSARIPLDFWVTAAAVESRKLGQTESSLNYRDTVNSLDIELRTDLLDLISQAGQIISSRQALDYARKHFDYVLEMYRLSGNSPSELSDAETLVRNNINQLNKSQYTFLSVLSKIRSTGVFDSEDEVTELIRSALAE